MILGRPLWLHASASGFDVIDLGMMFLRKVCGNCAGNEAEFVGLSALNQYHA